MPRQTMLFSATISAEVAGLARLSLSHPLQVKADKAFSNAATLQQEFVRLKPGREHEREAVRTPRSLIASRLRAEGVSIASGLRLDCELIASRLRLDGTVRAATGAARAGHAHLPLTHHHLPRVEEARPPHQGANHALIR